MSVQTSTDGPVLTVVIDRPEVRNAVDRDTATALVEAFEAFDRDDALSVAILTGADGTFCAGADLQAVAAGKPNRVEPDGPGPLGPSRMRLSKPVIAAIEGYAVAGGLELALWADLRVAARDAVLGVFCRRWGVPLIDGGTVRLPRLIGESRAMDLVLTGRPVPAQEAYDIGLVNRLAAPGQAHAAAAVLARELAAFPQACLRSDRLSLLDQAGLAESDALAGEFRHGLGALERESVTGAIRFSEGAGRHGRFGD